MLGSRLRNGKNRMLIVLPLGVVFVLGILILRDINSKLNEARSLSEKCQQHEESLSAQLQVVFEHKSRLEKSLQVERSQFKKSKDELQAQNQELRDDKEKEKQEAANRFNSLQQQHKMLQIQMEDLQEDLHKVQQSNQDIIKEKEQLQNNLNTHVELGKQKEIEADDLKAQIKKLQYEIQTVNKQIADRDQQMEILEGQLKECQQMKVRTSKSEAVVNKKPENNQSSVNVVVNPVAENKIESHPIETNEVNVPLKADLNISPKKNDEETREKKSADALGKEADLEDNVVVPLNKIEIQPKEAVQEDGLQVRKSKWNKFPANIPVGKYPFGNGVRGLGGNFQKNIQQLEKPNNNNNPQEQPVPIAVPENQQLVIPESGRLLNQKVEEEEEGMGVLKVPIGLEQQENGDDQDLDNMDDEEGGAGGQPKGELKEGKLFEEADFDQNDEEGGGNVEKHRPRQEGVMVAPH